MNQYTLLLTIGCLYVLYKGRSLEALQTAQVNVHDWMVEYDKAHPNHGICTGNILCSREGARHKANCMGKI